MRTRLVPVLLFAVGLTLALRAQAPPSSPELRRAGPAQEALAAFKAYYEAAVPRAGIVGSSVRIVHDDLVVFRDTVGWANLEKRQPVDEETAFHWASITKTFTAIALMQLRDRGLVSLDDPIVKYIPELREVHDPFGPVEAITLRHLLSHSAGFRNATWPWGGDKPWEPFEPPGWLQLRAMFPYTQILFPPGSKYSYSNPGLVFIGRVIEEVTNEDYETYVEKNVLRPLEMSRAYFDKSPYFLLRHRAESYFLRGGQPEPARFDFDTGVTVSNGGLNAPLGDMVKYLRFLMGAPGDAARQARYDEVLSRASLAEMWTPVVPVLGDDANGAERASMGLSFFLERHGGLDFVAHSGGQNGFISHFYVHLPSRTAYIVAFNTLGDPPSPDGRGDTRKLDREIRDDLVAHVFPLYAGK
jgi:CubicO group peptidase (beta-lactamase class C family)